MELLKLRGVVLPWGVTVDREGEEPCSYFPADQHRGARVEELLDLVEEELCRRIRKGGVGAAAIICPMESDEGAEGFLVQLESPAASLVVLYPYQRSASGWVLGEMQEVKGFMTEPLFGRQAGE